MAGTQAAKSTRGKVKIEDLTVPKLIKNIDCKMKLLENFVFKLKFLVMVLKKLKKG
jgi:hypothetical protein